MSKRYLVVVEQTSSGYSAYSPDLPGCVASGQSQEEVEQNIRQAIEFHIDGLREEGEPVPEPHTYSSYIQLSA
jgi:predicted RNase H-like HicB family nuclease